MDVPYDLLGTELLQGLSTLDQKLQILSKKFKDPKFYSPTDFVDDRPILEAKLSSLQDENRRLILENELLNLRLKSNQDSPTENIGNGNQQQIDEFEEKWIEWKKLMEQKELQIRELREMVAKLEMNQRKPITLKIGGMNSPLGDRNRSVGPSSTTKTDNHTTQFRTNSDVPFSSAFGTFRGSCSFEGCNCIKYVSSNNGKCEKCDHFPAQHEERGKASSRQIVSDPLVPEKQPLEKTETVSETTKPLETPKDSEVDESEKEATTTASTNNNEQNSEEDITSPSTPTAKPRRQLAPKIVTNRDIRAETQEEIRSNLDADWLVDYSDLKFITKMGRGVSSTVWKGTLKEEEVAIKVLRLEQKMQDLRDFKEELFIMSQLKSPYIVHFFGATLEPKLCIVMELCINGSLCHYLAKPTSEVSWERIIKWSTEIVRGINTLHLWKPPLVHRDLKTLNLLLDRDFTIKVCDFGLSRYTQGEQCDDATLQKLRGTYAYTAPEMYYSKNYTAKADVYSIGVILWELVVRLVKNKHCKPYSEYNDIKYDYQIIFQVAHNQRRPTIPPECPSKVKQIIEKCWSQDPEERPTAAELLVLLKNIKAKKKTKWFVPANTPPKKDK